MVSNINIMRKSGEKQRHDVELLIVLRYSLHGLHAFPNTVINVSIARKSEQIRKKWRHLIVNNVGILSTWSVCIS